MGVNQCDVNGCDYVACDTYIEEVGMYVCPRCLSEMKTALGGTPTIKEVEDFLDTPADVGIVDLGRY